jgi:hypothetical protein
VEKGRRKRKMGVDLEAIRRRVQELQKGRSNSNVQLWKPKEAGEYTIRGLPWPTKYLQPGQPLVEKWFYYIGDSFGLLAPNQFGKPDPIREFIDSLYKSGTPDDRNMAKKLKPKMQAYLPIVVKKGKDADPGKVIVWSINKFLYQKLLGWFLDEEIGDYLDPDSGFDIKVTFADSGKKFKGKSMLNSDVELARKTSKLANDPETTTKLLDAIPNIDDMYQLKSYDELKSILEKWLEGGDSSSSDDDDGSQRNASSGDALDELANDIKSSSTKEDKVEEKIVEKTTTSKAEKTEKKKASKKDDDEPEVKKQSLDEAFEELMADED